jgi:hypothetical protein
LRPLGRGPDPALPAQRPTRRPHEALEPASTSALGTDHIEFGRDLAMSRRSFLASPNRKSTQRPRPRAPQLGYQQAAAAEHVERQDAIAVVVTVVVPPLLILLQRIISRIEVENKRRGTRSCASTNRSTRKFLMAIEL